jgi:N-acetyl-gamma-glutamyl-phosphate reductase
MQNMNTSRSVAIIGASGYSGVEATRILAQHPQAELKLLASDRWNGDSVRRRLGIVGKAGELKYTAIAGSERLAAECDAVLLATPAETSLSLVPALQALGARVIDLSGAFRLKNAAHYPTFYGFSHNQPALLEAAVYGIPELFREELRQARLVANPGCYPTVAALALAPLLKGELLENSSVVVDAASGTTGAGRKSGEEMSFSEVDEDFRAYRVLRHQHTPEISEVYSRCAGRPVALTFTPHLLPVKRGILATIYVRLKPGRDPEDATRALQEFYRREPFVEILESPDEVSLKSVVGSNRCVISLAFDHSQLDPGRLVVVAAIDNLIKGAAGQAVQNLNLALGWSETEGLTNLRGFYP